MLSFSTDLDEIKAKMIEDVGKYSTDTSGVNIDPDKFGLLSDSVELAIGNVVTKIDTIQYADVKANDYSRRYFRHFLSS